MELSAIPLAVNAGLALQPAVDEALVILRHSISRLSAAAERIILEVPEGIEERKIIVDYVNVMKTNQTGHHYWSVRSGRYFLIGSIHEDGTADIEF